MGLLDELKSEIPTTTTVFAFILLLINIFLPGIGTIIMSLMDGFKPKTLVVGILQIVLIICLIGWIWSIWWGILCFGKAK